MDLPITDELRAEIARYRLQFCCEDCRHFHDQRRACDLLYPVEPHLRASFEEPRPGARLVFCKMFEAG